MKRFALNRQLQIQVKSPQLEYNKENNTWHLSGEYIPCHSFHLLTKCSFYLCTDKNVYSPHEPWSKTSFVIKLHLLTNKTNYKRQKKARQCISNSNEIFLCDFCLSRNRFLMLRQERRVWREARQKNNPTQIPCRLVYSNFVIKFLIVIIAEILCKLFHIPLPVFRWTWPW